VIFVCEPARLTQHLNKQLYKQAQKFVVGMGQHAAGARVWTCCASMPETKGLRIIQPRAIASAMTNNQQVWLTSAVTSGIINIQ
jgi:hypothetical protein